MSTDHDAPLHYHEDEPAAVTLAAIDDSFAHELQRDSVWKIVFGKRLARVKERKLWQGGDRLYKSFNDYVVARPGQATRRIKVDTARHYMDVAGLPLQPLAGTNFPLDDLRKLATQVKSRTEEEALPIIEAFKAAGGKIAGPKRGKTDLAARAPAKIAALLIAALRRAVAMLAVLAGKVGVADAAHKWVQDLGQVLRELLHIYLAMSGQDAATFLGEAAPGERRAWARTGAGGEGPAAGPGPRGPDDENAQGSAHLDQGPAFPEGAGEQGPAPVTPDEPWYAPVARALVAATPEEQRPLLSGHLLMALCGKPPAPLLDFVRGLDLGAAPEALQADVAWWLRNAGKPALEARWPFIYNVFTSAQLPEFRQHLHLLLRVALPAPIREVLKEACAYWHEDPADPPLPEPGPRASADERLRWAEDLMRRAEEAEERYLAAAEPGATVSVIPQGWLFGEALTLNWELDSVCRRLRRQLGIATPEDLAPIKPTW